MLESGILYGESDMKKKSPLRWDKVIAWITVVAIVCCGFSIYRDFNGSSARGTSGEKNNKSENSVGATKQGEQGSALSGERQVQVNGTPTVCIDAGHGGADGGAEYKGMLEKTQSLDVALLVRQYLEESGVQVVMTRTTDVKMELEDRIAVCNQAKAAAMVSIHRNYYAAGTSVNGVEAWVHSSSPADSVSLSKKLLSQLKNVPGVKDRGVKTGTMENAKTNYYINAHSSCASCLLELGFINNASDTELVTKYKEKAAKAISDGIISYLRESGYAL